MKASYIVLGRKWSWEEFSLDIFISKHLWVSHCTSWQHRPAGLVLPESYHVVQGTYTKRVATE